MDQNIEFNGIKKCNKTAVSRTFIKIIISPLPLSKNLCKYKSIISNENPTIQYLVR